MNVSRTPMRTPQPPQLAVKNATRTSAPSETRAQRSARRTSEMDEFFRKRTPQEVSAAQNVIAQAHRAIGGIPLRNADKAAYIRGAEAQLAKAKAALDTLHRAEMDGVMPREAYEAQRQIVGEIALKVADAKARLQGEPLIGKPLNPFRPLWQASSDLARQGGIIGGLLAPIGIIVDIVDAVTRPVQALLWPVVAAGHYGEKALRAVGKLVGLG